MNASSANSSITSFGSQALDEIVERLKKTNNPKRRYEYVLWLAKQLPTLPNEFLTENIKVKGCVSDVYVLGELINGQLQWKGFSDALITRGLLALLIKGMSNLTPEQVIEIDNSFIAATGLQASLTPSRANGFLNILLSMKAQARALNLGTPSCLPPKEGKVNT